jgi:hypothetical protein
MDVVRVRFKERILRWCSLAAELHHVEREISQYKRWLCMCGFGACSRGYIEGCARVGSLCFLFSL